MTIFYAVLDCRHPLCVRGPDSARRAPLQVISASAPDATAFAEARVLYADARARRCQICHRPISLRGLALIEVDRDFCSVQRYTAPGRPIWALADQRAA